MENRIEITFVNKLDNKTMGIAFDISKESNTLDFEKFVQELVKYAGYLYQHDSHNNLFWNDKS